MAGSFKIGFKKQRMQITKAIVNIAIKFDLAIKQSLLYSQPNIAATQCQNLIFRIDLMALPNDSIAL